MSIFKCKMCGGTLEISENQTTAVCEYCGTEQTLPRLDDDRKANLYDRANHFRRNNEFDKAMSIYETILSEDSTDAEAYWSLVLCRYGIEYVEDPATHKRVPTVNRAQFTSIFDDDNYKSALQNADISQRGLYEAEARAINEIQKGILAISQKEEPFDVFICYKETDNNGRRTPDSVLANDLYHQLTQEGFKVFFARITLEDKLGSAYEPYIFAALNSAKVIVVLGTRPEYFKAVWVKNEWSRYLALVKQSGGKKVLIPAYKDMDPYDLPEEFSHLQAQDMGKLGFMQDLIRGIKKLTLVAPQVTVKETVITSGNANVAPLLKRAFMYLEDKEWKNADEYSERVLDMDPENAEAYLVKLLAELECCKPEALQDEEDPFDYSSHYQKAIRFANDSLKATLTGYIEHINTRNELATLEEYYNAASEAMQLRTEADLTEAAEIFEDISGYKDSAKLAVECRKMAEIARKDAIYDRGQQSAARNTVSSLQKAVELFKTIPGWKDADEQVSQCLERSEVVRKDDIYNNAQSTAARNTVSSLQEAAEIFKTIPGWKDADEQVSQCLERAEAVRKDDILASAKAKMTGSLIKNYEQAIKVLASIPGWKDADEQMDICNQKIAALQKEAEAKRLECERMIELAEKRAKRKKIIAIITAATVCAVIAFLIVLNSVIIPNGKYNDAIALMEAGQIVEAYEALIALDGYKDSAAKADSIYEEYKSIKLKNAKVGDYVIFGAYEQDNNTSNGKEEIEWLVLDVQDGKVLVISKNALDCQKYNTEWEYITWETCTLRSWLNNNFISTAFSAAEQSRIPTVTVSADRNPEHNTNPGNATQDQVFLLSITEANKYFSSDSARQCQPTAYAAAKGEHVADNGNCQWWLRSPGSFRLLAASVYHGGGVDEYGDNVYMSKYAVRPALWINLE